MPPTTTAQGCASRTDAWSRPVATVTGDGRAARQSPDGVLSSHGVARAAVVGNGAANCSGIGAGTEQFFDCVEFAPFIPQVRRQPEQRSQSQKEQASEPAGDKVGELGGGIRCSADA